MDSDGNERTYGRALTPCGRTRREFFWESAGGFVGTALATLLAEDGFFARSAAASEPKRRLRSAAGAQGTAFPGQGQGVHRAVHVRRRQPGRYLRPQARAHPAPRQADPDARQRPAAQGPQSRDAAGLVAQVRPARPSRERSVSDLYPHLAAARRRHRGHPQHVHRQLRARLGPAPDEHRLCAPGVPEPGLVGDVRAGDGEPEPARLRRLARSSRRADLGPAQLGLGLHAGDLPGDPVSHQRRPDLEPAAAAGNLGRPAAQPARPAGQAEPAAGRRRQRRAGGPHRQLRAGLPDAGRAPPRPSTWRANRPRRSGSTGSTTPGPSGSAGAA